MTLCFSELQRGDLVQKRTVHGRLTREEVTRAYWEAKGANSTAMVTAAVEAGRGPVWDDPCLFLTQ